MTRLRIAMLTDHLLALAGTEASLVGAAVGLRTRGHEVIVCVYAGHGPTHPYWLRALGDAGVEIFQPTLRARTEGEWTDFCEQAERRLRDWKPDVVHAIPLMEIARTWAIGGYLPHVPRVATENSEASPRCTWYDPAVFPAFQRYDALIAPCDTVARGIRSHFGYRGRVAVVPHPICVHDMPPPAIEPSDLERRWTLGAITRFTVEKGPEFMVAALAMLARRFDEVTLTIHGDTYESSRTLEVAQALGVADRLFVPGPFADQAEMSAVVRRHCIFVLSSLFESLPMAVLHVAARGRVTVATRVGGIAEFMDEAGCDTTVPVGDPRAMADVIGRLLERPELIVEEGRRAARLFARKYALDSVMAQLTRLYADLADDSRAPSSIALPAAHRQMVGRADGHSACRERSGV
jgi:glycosyltransferase involved in cell wall biosynthesis